MKVLKSVNFINFGFRTIYVSPDSPARDALARRELPVAACKIIDLTHIRLWSISCRWYTMSDPRHIEQTTASPCSSGI